MTTLERSKPARDPSTAEARSPGAGTVGAACCAALYGDPLIELLVGDSLHPGGLTTTRRLLSAARLAPGSRLLDAGCGLGASARLADRDFGLRLDACDVSTDAIARAERLSEIEGARVRYRQASLLELPYRDGAFDAVLVECVLSTTDKEKAIAEARRVLAPGGVLLLSDVTTRDGAAALPEPLATLLCLSQAWRPGELERLLPAAGIPLEQRWDETAALPAFLDRLEARSRLLRSMARDDELGVHIRRLAERLSAIIPDGERRLPDLLEDIRRKIDQGEIGYVAVVARAG